MKFGQFVTVNAIYKRRGAATSGASRKVWEAKPITPCDALYVGWRTLSNGRVTWEDSEVGYVFWPEEHFKAALVIFSEREKPVFVPIDAICAQDQGNSGPPLMLSSEVARLLNVHPRTVLRMVHDGRLRAKGKGRGMQIITESVEAYIKGK